MRLCLIILLTLAFIAICYGKAEKKPGTSKAGKNVKEASNESNKNSGGDSKQSGKDSKQSGEDSKQSGEDSKQSGEDSKQSGESKDIDESGDSDESDGSEETGISLKTILSPGKKTKTPAGQVVDKSVSIVNKVLQPLRQVAGAVSNAVVNLLCAVDGKLIPCKDAQGSKYSAPLNFRCRVLADVIFVVDSSGSIGPNNFKKQLSFVANMAASYFIGTNDVRIGLVVFSTNAQIWFNLKEYKDLLSIQKAILDTPYEGGTTYTDKALKLVSSSYMFESSSGGRDNAPDIAVVLTDGQSTNPSATLTESKKLKSLGVTMLSVGITSGIEESELLSLASRSEYFFKVDSFDALGNILGQLVDKTCSASEGVKVSITATTGNAQETEPNYYEEEPQYNEQETQYNEYKPQHYQEYEPAEPLTTTPKATVKTKITTTAAPKTTTRPTTTTTTTRKPTTTITTTTTAKPTTTTTTPKPTTTTTTTTTTAKPTTTTTTTTTPKPTTRTTITQKPTTTTTATPKPTTTTTTTPKPTTTTTRKTTTLPPPPKVIPCRNATKADIILLIDASTSIGPDNWQKQVKFAAEVVQAFTVGPKDVLFGALIFNRAPTKIFDLKTFTTQASVSSSLLAIPYPNNSGTNTHLGLSEVRISQLFSTASGGRVDARDMLIVMTDGQSNNPEQTKVEANLLLDTGVTIISVGIGVTNTNELNAIASKPEYVFTTGGYEMLDYVKRDLVKLTCDSA